MDFFQTKDTRTFFDGIHKKMQTEVDAMSDSEITSCDFDEWESYLINKYRVEPITIFEDNIHRDLEEVKVKKANPFYQRGYSSYGEPQYFQVDGVCVIFKIYYDGDPVLFTLQPSSRILLRFSADNFKEPIEVVALN